MSSLFDPHGISTCAPPSWSNCMRAELMSTDATELPHKRRQWEPSAVRSHYLRVQEAPSRLEHAPQPWSSCPDFPPSTPTPLAASGGQGVTLTQSFTPPCSLLGTSSSLEESPACSVQACKAHGGGPFRMGSPRASSGFPGMPMHALQPFPF